MDKENAGVGWVGLSVEGRAGWGGGEWWWGNGDNCSWTTTMKKLKKHFLLSQQSFTDLLCMHQALQYMLKWSCEGYMVSCSNKGSGEGDQQLDNYLVILLLSAVKM